MSSIGPQLPPSLPKRKRTPDNTTESSNPPTKKRANTDEIDLEDDDTSSDDGYGPSAGPPATASTLGPSLPPSNTTNNDEITLQDSSEDDYAPKPNPSSALPPKASSPSPSPSSDSDSDYGPSLPNASTQKPQIGPSMPPPPPDAPQRDSWMLAPPTSSSYAERDPTKLRARKFAGKKSASAQQGGSEISSIWTETPEQKLKRLQDAVLGRAAPASSSEGGKSKKSKENGERERKMSENIEKSRGKSLYREHQSKRRTEGIKKDEEEDDPSKRGFDREKDMAIGGKIGTKERRELMNKASDFGGRFAKGSYL